MDGRTTVVHWKSLLDTEMVSSPLSLPRASYVQAASRTYDVPNNQLPLPCRKGDKIVVTIPEEEYVVGLNM
ncbi:hypothetical protein Fmac_021671 [Flemingia macrophylla]|uniref:Uncharacterized protein n=1 Tax=Flemingia macrophylla TaxID=520843 RepID=A0ABD1LXI8_9FABA